VVLMGVAETNYCCVYVCIGSYGKDCDSTAQKVHMYSTSL